MIDYPLEKRRNAHGTGRETPPRSSLRSEGERRVAVDLRLRAVPEPAVLRRLAQAHQGRGRGEALLVRRGRQTQRGEGQLPRDTHRRGVGLRRRGAPTTFPRRETPPTAPSGPCGERTAPPRSSSSAACAPCAAGARALRRALRAEAPLPQRSR